MTTVEQKAGERGKLFKRVFAISRVTQQKKKYITKKLIEEKMEL